MKVETTVLSNQQASQRKYDIDGLQNKCRPVVDRVLTLVAAPGCTVALDQMIAKKPAGLIRAQQASFERMYERLLELGWSPERLVVNPVSGCIAASYSDGQHVIFLQLDEDVWMREKVRLFREELPQGLHIQLLPLDHVGALPTFDVQAFIGFSSDGEDDFIAISSGIMKFGWWALATAKSMGHNLGRPEIAESSEKSVRTQDWWRSSLRPLALDILGCTVDPKFVAGVVACDITAPEASEAQNVAGSLMQAFVILHEIGHYERGHGWLRRVCGLNNHPETHQCWLMEAEADEFALWHLVDLANAEAAARTICLLFLLFAMSPEHIAAYPSCPDGDLHPHPLTRLIWLLRRLHPNDLRAQCRFVNFVIDILLRSGGIEDSDHMRKAICTTLLAKSPPPVKL